MSARKRVKSEEIHPGNSSKHTASEHTDFESAMQNLERVIGLLEQDDIPLEHALESFEEGIRLMQICNNHLSNARGKISQLLENDESGFAEKILGSTLESFLHQDLEHE